MRSVIIAVLLAVAFDVHAARFEVIRDGKPVEGAEVCLFRAGESATPITHPLTQPSPPQGGEGRVRGCITRFFASSELRCAPAKDDIEIGAGRWNAFARKGSELVSEDVLLVTAEDARASRPRLELVRAATLHTDATFAWIPRSRSAIPLGTNNVVPAATVVPLVVDGGAIARVGAPVTLEAGEVRKLEPTRAREGHFDAAIPILFKSLPEKHEPPEVIVIDATGRRHTPVLTLANRDVVLGNTLVFFRELPRGAFTAKISGKRWKSYEGTFADASQITRLDARATSKLTLHWWTAANLVQLASLPRACEEKVGHPEEPAETRGTALRATLLFCGDTQRDLGPHVRPVQCAKIAERELPLTEVRGEVAFDDVTAGVYFITVEHGRLPMLQKKFEVTAAEGNEVDFELRWVTFYGKVTYDGEPVAAEVFGTVSDAATGRYDAVMPGPSRPNPVTIATCDGTISYEVVPDPPPVENAAYDIEIPRNRIDVEVMDAATKQPIENANVNMDASFDDDDNALHFGGPAGQTDRHGRLVIEPVLQNKRIRICASSDKYQNACADLFRMGETKEKHVRLELQRLNKLTGRIITTAPLKAAQLTWMTRSGVMTEIVRRIDAEGRFTYTKPHAEGEILTLIAAEHPLFATWHPHLTEGEELVLRVPNAPSRTFRVELSGESDEQAFLALRIGDVVVSNNVLSWHMGRRQRQTVLAPGQSVLISDILATGPIRVILLPFSLFARYKNVELPLVPEIGSFAQQDVGEREVVTFGARTPRAITAPPASTSFR